MAIGKLPLGREEVFPNLVFVQAVSTPKHTQGEGKLPLGQEEIFPCALLFVYLLPTITIHIPYAVPFIKIPSPNTYKQYIHIVCTPNTYTQCEGKLPLGREEVFPHSPYAIATV